MLSESNAEGRHNQKANQKILHEFDIISRSALEIVTKLCDLEFARKAKAADFLEKAWEGLREAGAGDGDKVQIHSVSFPGRHSPV